MLIRDRWGIPDSPELTMEERFRTKYRGIRVSFGYPACPELADQEKLFRLIHPEEIGISLTEGFMMEPEASVTLWYFLTLRQDILVYYSLEGETYEENSLYRWRFGRTCNT